MWTEKKRINSSNENVAKFVYSNNNAVAESVLYKYPTYEDRTVICCSTQSGCPVGCRFCGAGDHFVRSLSWFEILEQVVHSLDETGIKDISTIKRLQIMFMSMGEPMLNYPQLAMTISMLYMAYPHAKLLISTSAPRGVSMYFKCLEVLSRKIETIGLQFSVHESTNEARRKLIPSNTMDLEEISDCGVSWFEACGRHPFFNYCVHVGNDTEADVDRLVSLFNPKIWQSTISVICERDEHVAAANERQRELASNFMQLMMKAGYSTRMFDPAGQDDTGSGCGQLWFVQEWMRQKPELVKRTKGHGLPVVHTPRLESSTIGEY